ncbi:hypothetical protein M9Y10_023416 [Tritrichomonas musculus]|uniref:Small GTP-binding protein n=1 Tax=Tritrichomonas musculus TaxID=1915356 RepID=A0ABR2KV45_9EUKA
MTNNDSVEIKIILLGDSAVGKTSILTRIIQNTFTDNQASTIGATYSYKKVRHDDREIQMQIWDTAGQERYRCLAPIYYRGTNVVFLVYSRDDRSSFSIVDYWINSLNQNGATPTLKFLICNKMDITKGDDLISSNEGTEKAKEIDAVYYEVSAKTGNGIIDLVNTVAQMYIEKINDGTVVIKKTNKNEPKKLDKEDGCCS